MCLGIRCCSVKYFKYLKLKSENHLENFMKKRFGWTGKILRINLTDGKTFGIETDKYRDSYIGGRGIASRLYWENLSSRGSAFDPLSHIFFMTGPLAGTKAQGSSRWIVLGK